MSLLAFKRRVRTPTILQMEAVECGAACLAMVLAHFGKWVPLEELRIRCGVSRDGSNALNVLKAARSYGLEAQGMKVDMDGLPTLPMPLILFWEFNHFVVLEGLDGRGAHINDPALGRRTLSLEAFSGSFTGVALRLAPGPEFERGGRRPALLPALRRRLEGSRGAFAYITLATLLLVLPGIVIPAISKVYIDKFLVDGQETWVRPLIVTFALAAGMSLLLTWVQQHYLLRLQIKLAVAMTGRMLWHLLHLPVDYFRAAIFRRPVQPPAIQRAAGAHAVGGPCHQPRGHRHAGALRRHHAGLQRTARRRGDRRGGHQSRLDAAGLAAARQCHPASGAERGAAEFGRPERIVRHRDHQGRGRGRRPVQPLGGTSGGAMSR